MNGGSVVLNSNSVFAVNGDWDDQNGTFNSSKGKVQLTASVEQTISCGAGNQFFNLEFINDDVSVTNKTALTYINIDKDLHVRNKTNFQIGAVTVTVGNLFRFLEIESNASVTLNDNNSVLNVDSKLNSSGAIIFNAEANLNLTGSTNAIETLTTNNFGTITYKSSAQPQTISQPTSGNFNNLIFDQN